MRASKITIGIEGKGRPIYLTRDRRRVKSVAVGLRWRFLRWSAREEPMRWLTRMQRERIEEASFFELLQQEIPKRLLALDSG